MVEPTPSKDAFLVEHTDFSLREKIEYWYYVKKKDS